jgi:heptosyltransferase I
VGGSVDFGIRLPLQDPIFPRDWIPAGRFAVLLSNASRSSKLWPDERWRDVEGWLAEQGICSVLVWGTERERVATVRRAATMRQARVAPTAGLLTLGSVFSRATLVVGLDTGLTHWAAAVGASTVGIFCDYDPARVGLKSDERRVNLGGVGDPPSAEDVIDACRHVLHAAGASLSR